MLERRCLSRETKQGAATSASEVGVVVLVLEDHLHQVLEDHLRQVREDHRQNGRGDLHRKDRVGHHRKVQVGRHCQVHRGRAGAMEDDFQEGLRAMEVQRVDRRREVDVAGHLRLQCSMLV